MHVVTNPAEHKNILVPGGPSPTHHPLMTPQQQADQQRRRYFASRLRLRFWQFPGHAAAAVPAGDAIAVSELLGPPRGPKVF